MEEYGSCGAQPETNESRDEITPFRVVGCAWLIRPEIQQREEINWEHFHLEGSILAWHQMIERDGMVFATSA